MATYRILEKPMTGCLAGQGSPRLLRVDETRFERTWDKLVGRWHYLGSAEMVGSRLKYLICLEEIIVGAISFCAAAFRLGPRDRFVGWDGQERKEWLPRLVENNRFLILPWVRMKNLASATLAESLRALKLDWADKYGVVPAMVETFVDGARFDGTCYRAANWIHLGLTQGYGRSRTGFVHHGNKKAIYVYVLDKSLMLKFKPSVDRLADPVEEIEVMINGIPQWCGSLIKQIGVNDISDDDVRQMLAGHISSYTPYLGRKEHHHHFAMMVQGMLSDINRKSIEPIALAFSGPGGVRTLTKFMADAKWDDGAMKAAYQSDLSRLLAGDEGMITGDDTGYPKKGEKSVGVSRQYRGNSGKIDNCQVAPMVGFVNGNGYGIYDWKLYMPQKWFSVEYSDLSKKCKIPEDLVFETKNSLLLDMIKKAHGSGNLRARYVGVDSSYGADSAFLDGLPGELIYFADVRKNQLVFASRPETHVPGYPGKGRRPTKVVSASKPVTVEQLAMEDPAPYNDVALGIGAKGPIFSKDKAIAAVEVRDGLPGKDVWVYVRHLEDGSLKYSLTNAPAGATLDDIRKPALMRWSIEQCFKELKDYLGMDHCEARSWTSFHRYILISAIAHLFLNQLRQKFSIKMEKPGHSPYIDSPVPLRNYLEAAIQLRHEEPISDPDIKAMPDRP